MAPLLASTRTRSGRGTLNERDGDLDLPSCSETRWRSKPWPHRTTPARVPARRDPGFFYACRWGIGRTRGEPYPRHGDPEPV